MKTQRLRRLPRVIVTLALLIALAGVNSGCFRQRVQVGAGASGGERTELRQWFAFWGLLPITKIDPEAAIGEAENYTVESVFTPIDAVIGIFTSIATIYPKTIAIEK